MKSNVIKLKNRPEAKPTNDDFEFAEEQVADLKEGEILLKSIYVSVDPYLRGRMRDQKSYVEPFKLDEPITSSIVAEVIESKNDSFKKGSHVHGMLAWKQYQISTGKDLQTVDGAKAPLSAYLGVLGLTGLTAYFGLEEIGKLKEGETVVVSGAAGAVGSTVGQIAKLKGCNVVGIAGTDEKIDMIKSDFGFDAGINYETTDNIKKALADACPNGIDVYWDNVGGEISDAVFFLINQKARIVNCGAIAVYNDTEIPKGVSPQPFLIKNSALMQGFIVSNYQDRFQEGISQLAQWFGKGKLKHEETIVEGFDNIPQAFIDLFDGKNKGKMVVKVD